MIATTRSNESVRETPLFVAFELSQREWKLALTPGIGERPWVRTIPAGDFGALDRVVAQARARFRLAAAAALVSCYEAGRDGFWIHRALVARGYANRVVDSASIEVSRRAKRAKTDRLDALKLVAMLVRVWQGEAGVWREVQVPTAAAEAQRQVSRERTALTQERTALINQVRSWVATVGRGLPQQRAAGWWTTVRDWSGAALSAELQARIARADARLALLAEQLAALEGTQRAAMRASAPDSAVRRLVQLKGVATTSASVLVDEGLVWRAFRNRRQLGGLLGFAPTPYSSGTTQHEQGISRAGNARLQTTMIQLAWCWVRWQPGSPITRGFHAHFGAGQRSRKVGIVAVARKLLIALWRWATAGVEPEGAIFTAA
jgi:transposase